MESNVECTLDYTQDYLGKVDLSIESAKQLLERLLNSKSDRLSIKANDKGKNRFIWSQFDMAYLDGVEQQYACCKYCKTFVKYTGRTGTGGLMRHFCFKRFASVKEDRRPLDAVDGPPTPPQHPSRSLPTPDERIPLRLQIETLIHQKSPRIGYIPNYKGKSGVWSQFYMITLDNAVVNFACCITCHSIVTYMSRTGTGSMTRHKCQSNRPFKKYFKNVVQDELDPPAKRRREPEGFADVKAEEQEEWDHKKIKEEDEEDWTDEHFVDVSLRTTEDAEESDNNCRSLTSFLLDNLQRGKEAEERIPEELERTVRDKHLAFLKKSILDMFQNVEFLELAQTLVDLGAKYGKIDVRKMLAGKFELSRVLNQSTTD